MLLMNFSSQSNQNFQSLNKNASEQAKMKRTALKRNQDPTAALESNQNFTTKICFGKGYSG